MIWVVDKKVVPHLLTAEGLLAEVPLRISFEYAVESGAVVDGSLSIKVLFNALAVRRRFPDLAGDALCADVGRTAQDAVSEHLALSGLSRPVEPAEPVVVAAS